MLLKNGKTISNRDYDFLKRIALLLETVGCSNFLIKKTMNELEEFHQLIISDSDISILNNLGLRYQSGNGNEDIHKPLTVEKIIHTGRLSPTYCFTEEKRGMGVFNGILTGQCNEIALFSNRDNTAVCNLASICLPKFVKEDYSFDF